jgi:hypothetical protein
MTLLVLLQQFEPARDIDRHSLEKTGAPRPMKMGTILSPWHHEAGAGRAP